MKLTILMLATLLTANTTTFKKVWVSDDIILENVQMMTSKGVPEFFYNGKRIDERYIIVSCKKVGGYCLVERGK